ncbi:hypothetical protein SmJEL517_g02168 [Synchytrium microbalum]|uniref:U1 small nuclear ribonucleoprotein C n=1 Tax=Synchytrium microbalum TaxID=1806994 RepID=A0A507CDE3_9FUNG|nr:uncharacterized protein SmJEL517_g02168 [Synchytrium microbalum]TPX35585.1 hypothetical protein SmJEL517_g02168 [Synchytrium microbalum]
MQSSDFHVVLSSSSQLRNLRTTAEEMGRYYCDYCDIFLTHDSPSVRKAHNTGWKHRMQVQSYYQGLDPAKIQAIVERLTKAYEGKPGGPDFGFNPTFAPVPQNQQQQQFPFPPGGPPQQGYQQPGYQQRPPPGFQQPGFQGGPPRPPFGFNPQQGPPPGFNMGPPPGMGQPPMMQGNAPMPAWMTNRPPMGAGGPPVPPMGAGAPPPWMMNRPPMPMGGPPPPMPDAIDGKRPSDGNYDDPSKRPRFQ